MFWGSLRRLSLGHTLDKISHRTTQLTGPHTEACRHCLVLHRSFFSLRSMSHTPVKCSATLRENACRFRQVQSTPETRLCSHSARFNPPQHSINIDTNGEKTSSLLSTRKIRLIDARFSRYDTITSLHAILYICMVAMQVHLLSQPHNTFLQ